VNRVPKSSFLHDDDLISGNVEEKFAMQEIHDYMDSLVAKYPDRASILSIGQSFEKRDMRLLKIGTKGKNKPGFFVDAGIHGNEWTTVTSLVYMMSELITKYDTNSTYKELVDKIDFYMLPGLNPDGYENERKTGEYGRKTRSGPHDKYGSMGVDGNRNFDFHWMQQPGAGTDPSQVDYAGPKAFSEIECLNVANFLKTHNDSLKAFVSIHGYAGMIMYSYAYEKNIYPPDVEELRAVALKAGAAMTAVRGKKIAVGQHAETIYEASGTSLDWAKAVANIKYSYLFELPWPVTDVNVDVGAEYRFAGPPGNVPLPKIEAWAGIQTIAKHLISV